MDLQDKSSNDKNCFVDSGDPDTNATCIYRLGSFRIRMDHVFKLYNRVHVAGCDVNICV